MRKQDSGECLKGISVQRKQASLVSEGKKTMLFLGNQGQACWLQTSQEEKDSEQKLKSKVERKSFKGAETQNLQRLKIRQFCNDWYDVDSTVYSERFKVSDQLIKVSLKNLNQNKQSQIKRSISKNLDSTPSKRSDQGQSSSSSSQDVNQKKAANKVQALQKQSKLVAKVGNISLMSIEQQEAQD